MISSLTGIIEETSLQQFIPTFYGNSLASLSSSVLFHEMADGKSVDVDAGFIQGFDPALQPPIISTSLANLSIKENVTNNAWKGSLPTDEYWNFLNIKQFVPQL